MYCTQQQFVSQNLLVPPFLLHPPPPHLLPRPHPHGQASVACSSTCCGVIQGGASRRRASWTPVSVQHTKQRASMLEHRVCVCVCVCVCL
jgi:hypothetical protein